MFLTNLSLLDISLFVINIFNSLLKIYFNRLVFISKTMLLFILQYYCIEKLLNRNDSQKFKRHA